jgi:hypothetical protein
MARSITLLKPVKFSPLGFRIQGGIWKNVQTKPTLPQEPSVQAFSTSRQETCMYLQCCHLEIRYYIDIGDGYLQIHSVSTAATDERLTR